MSKKLTGSLGPAKTDRLAASFSRLGWLGFLVQVLFGSIPIVIMFYFFLFAGSDSSNPFASLPLVGYLSAASFLILLFTVVWFFVYTRMAKRIRRPETAESSLLRVVWIGLIASTTGIFFSMTVMLIEVSEMLFFFLSAPQTGIPAFQTGTGGEMPGWVSAVDMMSLMSLTLTVGAEVWALIFSLLLLSRTTRLFQ
jgi:hypothetical protein